MSKHGAGSVLLHVSGVTVSLLLAAAIALNMLYSWQIKVLERRYALYSSVCESETEWLSETELSNGAIAFRPISSGTVYVNPYFSCYTMLALLANHTDAAALSMCRSGIAWHFSHLNSQSDDYNGLADTIYDYTITVRNGTVVSEKTGGDYDSVDSYAAAFLLVLEQYYKAGGDEELLLDNSLHYYGVVEAMLATMSPDGLTYAKPDYPVEYLMDNCEVTEAMGAAADLLAALYIPAIQTDSAMLAYTTDLLARVQSAKDRIEDSLESKLWVGDKGYYAPSMQDTVAANFDIDRFYADAVSQLCPIIFGVIAPTSDRAKAIYRSFCERWDWEELAHVDEGATKYYWGMVAYCAAVMGDAVRLETFIRLYQTSIATDHAMPLFNSDAAWVVLACRVGMDDCIAKLQDLRFGGNMVL